MFESGIKIVDIAIGYAWGNNSIRLDPKWKFLRESCSKVGKEVEVLAKKSKHDIRVNVKRLRARHGGPVTEVIRERIKSSDILVFDVGSANLNVHIELGMALASHENSRNVFVFSELGKPPASDLAGFLFTEYRPNNLTLVDAQGFRAALRSEIIWVLRKKGISLID